MIRTLLEELRQLGVCDGDVLLVHSSLNALKKGYEDPDVVTPHNVIDTLLEAVGNEGTLLMPALSYSYVTANDNLFDVTATKSCVGVIPETFRTEYQTFRSMHPTHSVTAYGKLADELTKEHCMDRSPLGKHSPFTKLAEYGGKILMLGCGLTPMTYMHGVEERFGTDYVMCKEPMAYRLADAQGNVTEAMYMHHDFAGYGQRYDRLEEVMEQGIQKGKTLGGISYLLLSSEIEKTALKTLEKDQHYFVDRI